MCSPYKLSPICALKRTTVVNYKKFALPHKRNLCLFRETCVLAVAQVFYDWDSGRQLQRKITSDFSSEIPDSSGTFINCKTLITWVYFPSIGGVQTRREKATSGLYFILVLMKNFAHVAGWSVRTLAGEGSQAGVR